MMFYMANIAYRRKRKNNAGSYDTVYYETDSRIVMRPNGESVEESLTKNVYVRPNLLDNWGFQVWQHHPSGIYWSTK